MKNTIELLASVLIMPGAKLWTLDKWLAKLADRFGIAYQASPTANCFTFVPCGS